jgi:hypothetical protein
MDMHDATVRIRPGRVGFAAPAVATLLAALLLWPAAADAKSVVADRLDKLLEAGSISQKVHDSALADYTQARTVRKRLRGASRRDLSYTIKVAETLARAGRLTADRVDPVFLILKRNAYWFGKGYGPSAYGARRRFGSSRIYFQYFPGAGWQIHPLANFSKLNAVWTDKSARARRALSKYARELIGIGVVRENFLTWEYYFNWDGGRPPWISSISQGTAVQSLARAGNSLNDAELTAAAKRALGAFDTGAPVGLRTNVDGGSHYLIYPFKRRFRVLNAFIQSLIGLNDYYEHSGDKQGLELRNDGLRAAKVETKLSDTGAWSLYSVGGRESNLSYHKLLRDFLGNICDRIDSDVFCEARSRFTGYLSEKPTIKKIKTKVTKRRVYVWFTLSKMSTVTVGVSRAGVSRSFARARTSASTTATVGYGRRRFSVKRSGLRGKLRVAITTTDLAGNTRSVSRRVR